MSSRSKIWAWGLVCLVILQIAASSVAHRSFELVALSDVLQSVLLLSSVLSCFPVILRSRGRERLFWVLMAAGLGSWMTYQFVWTYIEVIQAREVPDLFSWDVLLFLHIVPMMAALALQPNVEQHERDLRLGSLDFAILLVWWIFVYVYSVMAWQFGSPNADAYQANLNSSYLIEKVALLGGLALLWFRSSGSWRRIYAQWFGASFLYSASSYIANLAVGDHTYYSGSLYDVPLVVSMAWMSLPGLLATSRAVEETKSTKSLPRGVWAARLGMVAVFSLPIFAWVAAFDGSIPAQVRHFRLLLTFSAMVVLGAMVFLKQHFLDIELFHLLRTSRQSFQELQLLQAQLIQSEKLASMGQLVGGAAHELNNPLTAMLGYSELLAGTALTPEQRSLTEKLTQQTRRVRGLVSSLLSFAKQVPTSKTSVDVNAVVQTCLKLCQPQMEVARVGSSIHMTNPLPRVHADSNQLLQVFSHIVNNAVHAMADRGGTIAVSTQRQDKLVSIQFVDTGPGILEPARVFDPFYTTRPLGQGSGLGLSACYGIIQEHGGKISCRNGETGGAIFQIELPAIEAASAETHFMHAHAAK
ncbi:MAG TPA: HAMP domain-containing sensor histidine kinase [Terriglobales bacterium]|jgi:signal transduction histidine kinase